MSEVIYLDVHHRPNGVQNTVEKALDLLNWKQLVKGSKIFVKINLMSSEFVTGQCTSPLVLDGLFKRLNENEFDVVFGDANLAAAKQCNKAADVWGHRHLGEKYGFRFQNLSEDQMKKVPINGKVFESLDIPQSILDADTIISVPVLKTHCLTNITCALKHFWGVVPRVRHQYHLVVDEAIADINQYIQPKLAFSIVDGTVGLEGDGPRTGRPKICDKIFASFDSVALDSKIAEYMGLSIPRHVLVAEKRGLGTTRGKIIGDDFTPNPFTAANPDQQPIFFWEMGLRKSFLKPVLFDTPLFRFLAWIATKYNTFYYYHRYGKKYTKKIMSTWYGKELEKVMNL